MGAIKSTYKPKDGNVKKLKVYLTQTSQQQKKNGKN